MEDYKQQLWITGVVVILTAATTAGLTKRILKRKNKGIDKEGHVHRQDFNDFDIPLFFRN